MTSRPSWRFRSATQMSSKRSRVRRAAGYRGKGAERGARRVQAKYPCRFGQYALVAPLGDGGMGDVCLAITGRGQQEKICVIKRVGRAGGIWADLDKRF